MEFNQTERLSLMTVLILGICFSVSQTTEEMLKQIVGESITLSHPTKQGGTLSYNNDTIAVVVNGDLDSSYRDSFKDRIQWDQQTGQFTIRDLRSSDSGVYVVDGKGDAKETYQLTVYEPVSRPTLKITVIHEICSVECSVKNDRDVTLSWYSGEEILNQSSRPELSIKFYLPLEVDIQNRTSYSCEAANPVTKEMVMFHVPESCMVHRITGERAYLSLIALMCILVASVLVRKNCRKKGRNVDSQDLSEGEQPDTQYAEISHIIPTSVQEERVDISEHDPPRETQLTVYDKLQLHRMADSGDVKTA